MRARGFSRLGARQATPRDPALRIPQQLQRASAGRGPGGRAPGTKLQETGPRRGPIEKVRQTFENYEMNSFEILMYKKNSEYS